MELSLEWQVGEVFHRGTTRWHKKYRREVVERVAVKEVFKQWSKPCDFEPCDKREYEAQVERLKQLATSCTFDFPCVFTIYANGAYVVWCWNYEPNQKGNK